ncbi:MAG: tRNA (guanosine(46)-N7)-methyltransferase TrmB [Fusobacteriaceae bacterium]|jgi:tRNA (guanine-N7-)-methyltransferase|nr:tRNA (guanosine(46)-N7)-methyltransferase TrmB [Fusobacteriaceae bacterium]
MERIVPDEFWKHFFAGPKKNYNPYVAMILDYPDFIFYDRSVMDAKRGNWREVFGNDRPISLEIGSGSGGFIRQLAKRHPDRNFLCLELRFKRLCMAAKKARSDGSYNVRFLRRRAEELEDFVGPGEIRDIYINFPDPWEEKLKNRIIQESFFDLCDKLMQKGGFIRFKSDHDGYYQDILDLVAGRDGYEVRRHTPDLHGSPLREENIKTEFEQLFLYKCKKNINYIEIEKV